MRVFPLLLVICLVLLVVVDGKKSKESKSKGSSSKGPSNIMKVSKVRAKPIRHHNSDSSESSEEHSDKHNKKHSEKFKIEERFHSRKDNSTVNRKKGFKLAPNKTSGGLFNNRTGKLILLPEKDTAHGLLKHNNTHFTGLNGNKTLIGWKIFAKPNMSNPISVNETKNYNLNNFLLNEKSVNGSSFHPNHNKWNNSMAPPAYGWNINGTTPLQGWKNINTSVPLQGWNNINTSVPLQGWKNINTSVPLQGWNNINTSVPLQGWKNINTTAPLEGWKNVNTTAPSQGWKNIPDPVQGNIEPSASDYRKIFSVPDHSKDQGYYFNSPGASGYFQRNPNLISNSKQPIAYPANPDYNRKVISNISPEYGWGVPQPSYTNNDQFNTDEKVFNNYPIYNKYGSSDKSSSKILKGVKKVFKKLGKGTGKVLSSDTVEDTIQKAASSYFANPPPNGWVYNPPYSNPKQTFYGSFSNSVGKEPLNADDWRSIIFGNVPRKVQTRNLYSAAFPETYQTMDLNAFSEKGRFPDFNRTQYKSFFPRPYYPKLFAGLRNEYINENFRAKRELSEKGKAMASVINKFFLHERDCNDTELNARRKRDLMIRPLAKKADSKYEEEMRITNFPFSGIEAIVQSDNGISVYEEIPKENQFDNPPTEKSLTNDENTMLNGYSTEKNLFTTEPTYPIVRNRTKLFPVSETIEQFLNKKTTTRLRVIDESLEKWKLKARSPSDTSFTDVIDLNDDNVSPNKRITRSDDISNESDFFYRWTPELRYSDNTRKVIKPNFTQLNMERMEKSEPNTDVTDGIEIESTTPGMLRHDSDGQISKTQKSPFDSPDSPRKRGFYFLGVYIGDYDGQKWENHVSSGVPDEPYQLEPSSEEAEITTHLPTASTDDNDLQTALMESSAAIPALSYSNNEDLFSGQLQSLTPTEPILNTHTEQDSYQTSNPIETTVYVPFRIHAISFISYLDFEKKEHRRSTTRYEDSGPVLAGESIIKAPLISNRCGRNQRMVKGRCRTVW